jgi:hypothetical protein
LEHQVDGVSDSDVDLGWQAGGGLFINFFFGWKHLFTRNQLMDCESKVPNICLPTFILFTRHTQFDFSPVQKDISHVQIRMDHPSLVQALQSSEDLIQKVQIDFSQSSCKPFVNYDYFRCRGEAIYLGG